MVITHTSPMEDTISELCSISSRFAASHQEAPAGIRSVLRTSSPHELLFLMARSNQRMRNWIAQELDRRSTRPRA